MQLAHNTWLSNVSMCWKQGASESLVDPSTPLSLLLPTPGMNVWHLDENFEVIVCIPKLKIKKG